MHIVFTESGYKKKYQGTDNAEDRCHFIIVKLYGKNKMLSLVNRTMPAIIFSFLFFKNAVTRKAISGTMINRLSDWLSMFSIWFILAVYFFPFRDQGINLINTPANSPRLHVRYDLFPFLLPLQ